MPTVDEIAHRIAIIERGNGHSNNNNDFDPSDYKSPYPNVKLPSMEFVGVMILEHPYLSLDDIVRHLKLRMKIRHSRPDMYKSQALASGEIYLPDMYEEFKEELLDSEQLERLRKQRARRERIGTITSCKWDKVRELLIYDVMIEECDDCGDGTITREKHLELLNQHKDI